MVPVGRVGSGSCSVAAAVHPSLPCSDTPSQKRERLVLVCEMASWSRVVALQVRRGQWGSKVGGVGGDGGGSRLTALPRRHGGGRRSDSTARTFVCAPFFCTRAP